MEDPQPHSALREWRHHIAQPTTLIVLAGIAAVLTIAGAFDTGQHLRFVPRLFYWLPVSVITYSVGFLSSAYVRRMGAGLSRILRITLASIATGVGVVVTILVANWAVFGFFPRGTELGATAGTIFAISAVITFVLEILGEQTGGIAPSAARSPPAILDRIPFDKRGPLIALSVEDHYVRVRTTMGEDMILMRLADAIGEVGETRGLQVHRSHWIATDQVTSAARKGDGAVLAMSSGPDSPVSRANVSAIKEAGLLPR